MIVSLFALFFDFYQYSGLTGFFFYKKWPVWLVLTFFAPDGTPA